MTQPIRSHYIDSIYLNANHVSKSNLHYLLKGIMSITNNQSKVIMYIISTSLHSIMIIH